MKTYLECIPCFLRQALDAARLASDDPSFHEEIVRRTLSMVAGMDFSVPPPVMGRDIHRLIRGLSGVEDSYRETKARFNAFILRLLPRLEQRVRNSADPFEAALRLAVAGNVIDFGIDIALREEDVEKSLDLAFSAELDRDAIGSLRQAVRTASRILYLGDNAGEVVFDSLFLAAIRELAPSTGLTFVVRGQPIINDITLEDALQAGIDRLARVIDNGGDAPGCVLEDCSEVFREHLRLADLVISKGQGNFETLCPLPQETFYLLKAKCPVIAAHIGVPQGSLLVLDGCRIQGAAQ
jgi:damage-control phosphatase, subfamily I